jgi:hypothetical protein
MQRTKIFTVTYDYFEPGTYVIMPTGQEVRKVIECHEPLSAGDNCVVFVEGLKYGINADRLSDARED